MTKREVQVRGAVVAGVIGAIVGAIVPLGTLGPQSVFSNRTGTVSIIALIFAVGGFAVETVNIRRQTTRLWAIVVGFTLAVVFGVGSAGIAALNSVRPAAQDFAPGALGGFLCGVMIVAICATFRPADPADQSVGKGTRITTLGDLSGSGK